MTPFRYLLAAILPFPALVRGESRMATFAPPRELSSHSSRVAPSHAGDPDPKKIPKKDFLGDPLPRGAIARLAGHRFAFAGNTKLILENKNGIAIVDFITGKLEESLDFPAHGSKYFFPGGKAVLSTSSKGNLMFFDVAKKKQLTVDTRPERIVVGPDHTFALVEATRISFWDFFAEKARLSVPGL